MGGLLVVARLHVGTLDAAEGSLSMKVFEKSETRWVEKNAVLKGPFCRKKSTKSYRVLLCHMSSRSIGFCYALLTSWS